MANKDLETLAQERIRNKYLLTLVVAKRINQLKGGAKPLVETDSLTPYQIALKEVVEGKITPKHTKVSKEQIGSPPIGMPPE